MLGNQLFERISLKTLLVGHFLIALVLVQCRSGTVIVVEESGIIEIDGDAMQPKIVGSEAPVLKTHISPDIDPIAVMHAEIALAPQLSLQYLIGA